MISFTRFPAGSYTDKDITLFTSENIIVKDRYLENGDIIFYSKKPDDIGMDVITKIERLDKAVSSADAQAFDAELGLVECDGNLADIDAQIAQSTPDDKEKWAALQEQRTLNVNQKVMHQDTIDGRNKQIFDLRAKLADLLATLTAVR